MAGVYRPRNPERHGEFRRDIGVIGAGSALEVVDAALQGIDARPAGREFPGRRLPPGQGPEQADKQVRRHVLGEEIAQAERVDERFSGLAPGHIGGQFAGPGQSAFLGLDGPSIPVSPKKSPFGPGMRLLAVEDGPDGFSSSRWEVPAASIVAGDAGFNQGTGPARESP